MPRMAALVLAGCILTLAVGNHAQAGKRGKTTKSLSLDGRPWSLQLDLPHFKVDRRETWSGRSQSKLFATSRKTSVVVSVFLEPESSLHSAEQCRDHYQAKSADNPLGLSDLSHTSTDGMARVHYSMDEFQGIQVMAKGVHAYMYRDGVCIDIHLSAIHHKGSDAHVFADILESARFADH